MVRHDVAVSKVGRARAWLNDAESLFARPAAEFRADIRGRDLALFYLFPALRSFLVAVATSAGV